MIKFTSCLSNWFNPVKKDGDFPVPSQDVTNQTKPGRAIINLFPARESLVGDIPAGDGKIANLFLQCKDFVKMTHRKSCILLASSGHLELETPV
jgi:hypothetical protein